MMVELHSRTCKCHGGSWMTLSGQSGSPCSVDGRLPKGALVVPLEQWKAMGKPHNVEEFYEFLEGFSTHPAGERRSDERYDTVIRLRLSNLDVRDSDFVADNVDETATENVSRGGARVRSQLMASKGDVVLVEAVRNAFKTRARIQNVTGDEGDRRLHLQFLDARVPESLLRS